MAHRQALFRSCVLTVLAGLAACGKQAANTGAPAPDTAAWPQADVLRMTLPQRAGQAAIEQRIHRDETIEWLRRDREGRIERWLQRADGTLQHRTGDDHDASSPPPTAATASPALIDFLAPLAGIGLAQAHRAATDEPAASNSRAVSAGRADGARGNGGDGRNRAGPGGGMNSGTAGGTNSGASAGTNSGANSGTAGG
ncbi:MAG: hypothetical protein KIS89_00550, partial [Dokdonella sp.]|nr:hypothetical protein [Dokdonella sp.]